jgi:hypothetical protein
LHLLEGVDFCLQLFGGSSQFVVVGSQLTSLSIKLETSLKTDKLISKKEVQRNKANKLGKGLKTQ